MFGIQKHKVRTWFAITSLAVVLISCSTDPQAQATNEGFEIYGETQGTTYNIIIADDQQYFVKEEIDSILHDFDLALSTYIDNSTITKLNNVVSSGIVLDDHRYFEKCYNQSRDIFQLTDGAFDPSVFPLVEGWGFMQNIDKPMMDEEVVEVMKYIGFDRYHTIAMNENKVRIVKENPLFKLDFNAIAQGYSVDVLAEFLERRGHHNFYVEIGGELIVRGLNREGDKWRIGIDAPLEGNTTHELNNIMHVSNKAIATSGNYRKFYERDGVKYAHTLNPKTGYPVRHSLLSVTVIAENCAAADAYATAFMVMGAEKTLKFVKSNPELNLNVYLLESGDNDQVIQSSSENFSQFLNK
ncbi:MAG: thiamine biosynthesis lipoprotein [Flavobacteriaceae bacterium]|jgi:thiamine biosynthesis lipoprotein